MDDSGAVRLRSCEICRWFCTKVFVVRSSLGGRVVLELRDVHNNVISAVRYIMGALILKMLDVRYNHKKSGIDHTKGKNMRVGLNLLSGCGTSVRQILVC